MSRRATLRVAAATLCLAALWIVPARALARSAPHLSVRSAALFAPGTGQLLYGERARRESAIASTTKLMTALIVLEHVHHLGTIYTDPNYYPASTDSQIGLTPGDRMSVHDLLIALMLPSADDAAYDLAYNVAHGSVARFVGMMNAKARELGLTGTHYSTPIGLDTPGNYSTASDLVRLADYDLTHSAFFARIVALPSAVLRTGPAHSVVNRNTLVGEIPWINGVKTGHTSDAGYVLVASGHRDGMTLISAVLGTDSESSRDANTMALLNYGFANFIRRTPVRAHELMARPSVRDSPGKHAIVRAARTFTRVLPRSDRVRVDVEVARRLTGPLPGQSVVGTAVVLADGRPIARIPLVLERALPAVSGLTIAARFITQPLMLSGILVALALVVALGGLVRRGGGQQPTVHSAEE
ncbi:MAG: D-alanyl-D-alanine carboxypeptidase family protein, partial [Solirubrobacteraceae bacterium]